MAPASDSRSAPASSNSLKRFVLRRRILVAGGFQTRFVVTQMVWMTLALSALSLAVFVPLVIALLKPGEHAPETANRFLFLHETAWPLFAGFFLVSGAISLLMTHRVAGPLYRFRRIFADVGRGVLTMRVRIRKGDYLEREAAELDAMVAALRGRLARAKVGLEEALGEAVLLADRRSPASTDELQTLARSVARARAALDEFETEASGATPAAGDAPNAAPTARPADRPVPPQGGFTLIELLLVAAIVSVLLAIAIPGYQSALNTARVTKAIADVRSIDRLARLHVLRNGCYPSTLADIGFTDVRDPWGRPYVYGVIGKTGGGAGGASCPACAGGCINSSQARKDRRLVPINADFDAYSVGPDGQTAAPLTSQNAQDDIVRGNNGGFYGLGSDY